MQIALVHDYLTQRGGAERVFEMLCRRFPSADLFTSVYSPGNTINLGKRPVHATYLQNLPGSGRYFRLLAPFYYPAFRSLDLQNYDLILSSTSAFAKSVQKRPDARHICFCHNVTRFLWDTKTYLRGYREYQAISPLLEMVFHRLRQWDINYAQEPDLYIANSTTVARRIEQIYSRPATTVHYPIDDSQFVFSEQKDDFYLVSCRLLSYKRVDIIVEAFNWLGWPLVIMGDGPERQRLEKQAMSNIQFLGHVSDAERMALLARAKMVVVAALEDYGLVPIEANFSGTPVVSYGAGGALDTQVPGLTGVFFGQQTPDALHQALLEAATIPWQPRQIREHALNHFTEAVFFEQVDRLIDQVCQSSFLIETV
ncbi:MAG: glycosyltransferase [Pegethrix bostrychoides GSE-TBD4-15B]|jgi:glycosyltransferase involved in cell wall biosynthesis|uniref:Glycosyltransferase n=1 Tax=Pegethrix bostrychoides GSE-TBD4-15B TaxID=2839662 RepID=A0A951U7B4_9CYAN|nr:glycosyltransferase [Pegethrix bostrychoides GSE-TBD4-15B]